MFSFDQNGTKKWIQKEKNALFYFGNALFFRVTVVL